MRIIRAIVFLAIIVVVLLILFKTCIQPQPQEPPPTPIQEPQKPPPPDEQPPPADTDTQLLPDLAIISAVAPARAMVGQPIEINVTIANEGEGPAPASLIAAHEPARAGAALAFEQVPQLDAGQQHTLTMVVPTDVPRELLIELVVGGEFKELRTDNNKKTVQVLVVTFQ